MVKRVSYQQEVQVDDSYTQAPEKAEGPLRKALLDWGTPAFVIAVFAVFCYLVVELAEWLFLGTVKLIAAPINFTAARIGVKPFWIYFTLAASAWIPRLVWTITKKPLPVEGKKERIAIDAPIGMWLWMLIIMAMLTLTGK